MAWWFGWHSQKRGRFNTIRMCKWMLQHRFPSIARLAFGSGKRNGATLRRSGAATMQAVGVQQPPVCPSTAMQPSATGVRLGRRPRKLGAANTVRGVALTPRRNYFIIVSRKTWVLGTLARKHGVAIIATSAVHHQLLLCHTTVQQECPTGMLDGPLARRCGAADMPTSDASQKNHMTAIRM